MTYNDSSDERLIEQEAPIQRAAPPGAVNTRRWQGPWLCLKAAFRWRRQVAAGRLLTGGLWRLRKLQDEHEALL